MMGWTPPPDGIELCQERVVPVGVALGRKAWLFAGSPRGGERAAFMYSLIVTARLNDIDPQTWLADVLARMPGLPVRQLADLLPWNWSERQRQAARAA